MWENHANLNDLDSKRSSSRSFHGPNLHPRVTGFVHAFSFIFFSLQIIFFKFPPKIVHQNYAIKYLVPLYLIHGFKNNTVFSECARANSFDYVYWMRDAKLRNHLNQFSTHFSCDFTFFSQSNFISTHHNFTSSHVNLHFITYSHARGKVQVGNNQIQTYGFT